MNRLVRLIVLLVLLPAGSLGVANAQRTFCTNGYADGYSCSGIDLLKRMPYAEYGDHSSSNDVWGWTDPSDGTEYVLAGRNDALAFIDISDPLNPVYVGYMPSTDDSKSIWRDMKVYADHVFVVVDVAGANGMQVFDLTNLSGVTNPPKEFSADAVYRGIDQAHNIAINEDTGYAYLLGSTTSGGACNTALHVVDISSPTSPSYAGCFADTATGRGLDGYIHDAQCVVYAGPDSDYSDHEICFTLNETHLSIVDVTDKSDMEKLASEDYPTVGYTHQGWLTEDHAYFLVNDEMDEFDLPTMRTRTIIWDVGDLEDPVVHGYHYSSAYSVDHNLYVHGHLAYMANYSSGLRVVDVSDPGSTSEIAFFNTVSSSFFLAFEGMWSVYPYFESEVIVAQSRDAGLFLLDLVSRSLVLSVDVDTVAEDGGATTIEVSASIGEDPYGTRQTIPITVAGSGASGSVGFAPVADFSFTLESGATSGSGTFLITPTDNAVIDSDESITISSTHADVRNSVTVVLEDDDAGQKPVELTVSPASLGEADGATTFTLTGTVTRGGMALGDLSLPIAVSGSGATDVVSFAAVSDFTLSIASGTSSGTATFTVTPSADLVYEYDETITISSTSALVNGSASIMLTDDDVPAITLGVSPASVSENGGAATITVSATASGNVPASAQDLPIAVDGSGLGGVVDFADVNGFSITMAAGTGTASGTFTLTPVDDQSDETDEKIYVSSTHAGIPDSVMVALRDDDDAPTGIALSVSPSTVAEGDGATTITLSAAVQGGTTYGLDTSSAHCDRGLRRDGCRGLHSGLGLYAHGPQRE